jgi:hypothetical protein
MTRGLDPREQATEVIRLAGLALRHFEVWRVYTDPPSREKLLPALRRFPDFVNLDEHAHQELCLLYLGSLFETNDGTINLVGLIKAAAAQDERFNAEKVWARLAEAGEIIKKIAMLRGGAVAHRSATLSRAALFGKAALAPDDLRVLVDDAEQIAYAIGRAFGIEPFTIAVLAPTELSRMFSRLLPAEGDEID